MRSANDFLYVSDFESGAFPTRAFEVSCDKLLVDDAETADVVFQANYDRHAELVLKHQQPSSLDQVFRHPTKTMVSDPCFVENVELLATKMDATGTTYIPRLQPVLWKRAENATTAYAILVNGPSLRFANGLCFSFENCTIECNEFDSAKERRKTPRLNKFDFVATTQLKMTIGETGFIDPQVAQERFFRLSRFFAFLRGGACGVGNIYGLDDRSQLTFAYMGFGKSDGFHTEHTWCDEDVIRSAPDVFNLYLKATTKPELARVLRRAIDYYRAANVGRDGSPEMALVASYAGLETLVPYILSVEAGWSNALIENRAPFADKLRAAAAFIGLTDDVFEHAPELMKRQTATPDLDPFATIALFRNRITHHKQSFLYNGREIMEAWQASQWLCELFVFYLIGYRGLMNDRRRYTGWKGQPVRVPIANSI